jgi:predicted MFS family arabinose efflux permease
VMMSCCMAGDFPMQSTLITRIVAEQDRGAALALRTMKSQAARLIGMSVAGPVVAAAGLTTAFAFNAATFVLVLIAVPFMRPEPIHRQERAPGQLRAALTQVRTEPTLRALTVLQLVLGTVTWPFAVTLLPLLAAGTGTGADGFGAASAAIVAGMLLGQGISGRFNGPDLAGIGGRVIVLGALMTGAASAPNRLPAVLMMSVVLCAIGFSWTGQAQELLHRGIPPRMVGRITAIYVAVGDGSAAIGALVVGRLANMTGLHGALAVCGLLTVAVGIGLRRFIHSRSASFPTHASHRLDAVGFGGPPSS